MKKTELPGKCGIDWEFGTGYLAYCYSSLLSAALKLKTEGNVLKLQKCKLDNTVFESIISAHFMDNFLNFAFVRMFLIFFVSISIFWWKISTTGCRHVHCSCWEERKEGFLQTDAQPILIFVKLLSLKSIKSNKAEILLDFPALLWRNVNCDFLIDLRFARSLPQSCVLLIWLCFDDCLEISWRNDKHHIIKPRISYFFICSYASLLPLIDQKLQVASNHRCLQFWSSQTFH